MAGWQARQPLRLGQGDLGVSVFDQEGQAPGGQFRIQRQPGGAGMDDTEQGDDHVYRAFHAHRHDVIGADAGRTQGPGNGLRPLIQLGVAQALTFEHQRRGVGAEGGLLAQGGVQVGRAAVVTLGGVPAVQLLLILLLREQLDQRSPRRRHQRIQQRTPLRAPALHRRLVEQRRLVFQRQGHVVAVILDFPALFELGVDHRQRLLFDLQSRPLAAVHAAIVKGEQHLEQRRAVQVAVLGDGADQGGEGQVRVGLGRTQIGFEIGEQLLGRGPLVDFAADHQGVDQAGQQRLGLRLIALVRRGAETNLALAAVTRQQCAQGRGQHHVSGGAALAGELADRFGALGTEVDDQLPGSTIGFGAPWMVDRQVELVVVLAQVFFPVLQAVIASGLGVRVLLPQGEVDIVDLQRRPARRLPFEAGGVGLGQLIDEQLHGPAVGGAVVQAHQ
ncbi:hypothetical protein ALQ77_05329 [Pseudomonas corrugata]|uniref:Uncharacterized protein n=1 Tax=Pseudomonas corrugata TaxID=47879 RepID=A0A3M3EKG8_9PSED|nr:hypothetical protein ALQ77_05329 [Pseudomonas corrugata]